jgi:hypothetical protein
MFPLKAGVLRPICISMRLLPAQHRDPAVPQRGLWATSETLDAEYRGHRIELVATNEGLVRGIARFELYIDGDELDNATVGVGSARDEWKLKAALPKADTPVEVVIEGGLIALPRYTLRIDGEPMPMAIRKGGKRQAGPSADTA